MKQLTWYKYLEVVFFVITICFFPCLQGCTGKSSNDSPKVGSVSFSIQWPANASMKQNGIPPEASSITNVDCASLGVATVAATFTDGSGATVASESWSCSDHTGMVDNIPEGSGYKIIVTAKDANGTGLYQGTKTGITIVAGQNTNIGTVPLDSVISLTAVISSPTGNQTITVGQSVNFQGSASGGTAPYTYSWSFGGGATNSSVQSPGNVTFSTPGSYTVAFTVTDSNNKSSIASVVVNVNSPGGIAAAITSPTTNVTIPLGESDNFQGTVTGGTSPYTYAWNFGGGATNSSVQNPGTVTFKTAGTYTVTFQVSDAKGATSSASRKITVLPQNTCLDFGNGDRVEVPNSTSLNPSRITIELWVNLATIVYDNNQMLIAKGSDGAQGSYYLSQNGDGFYFYIGENGVDQVYAYCTGLSLQTNTWYYVAGTYDGSNLIIYVNGTEAGSAPGTPSIGNSLILTLGCQG